MKPQLLEILLFLKNPSRFLEQKSRIPAGKGLLYAWANEINILLHVIGLVAALSIIYRLTGLDFSFGFPKRSESDNALGLEVFLLLIWAPIFEEAAFRGFLNLKSEYVWVSFLLFLFIVQKIFFSYLSYKDTIYTVSLAGTHALVGYGLGKVFKKVTRRFIENYLRPNFTFLVYASFIGFGLIHIVNFDIAYNWQWLLTPIITIPQLVSGVFLCYIRVNYGLIFSIVLHFLDNVVATLPLFSAKFDAHYLFVPIFILGFYLVRRLWNRTKSAKQVIS